MRKDDEIAVPIHRHGGEEIGSRLLLGQITGGDGGNGLWARRCLGQALSEGRRNRQCPNHQGCCPDRAHHCPPRILAEQTIALCCGDYEGAGTERAPTKRKKPPPRSSYGAAVVLVAKLRTERLSRIPW